MITGAGGNVKLKFRKKAGQEGADDYPQVVLIAPISRRGGTASFPPRIVHRLLRKKREKNKLGACRRFLSPVCNPLSGQHANLEAQFFQLSLNRLTTFEPI